MCTKYEQEGLTPRPSLLTPEFTPKYKHLEQKYNEKAGAAGKLLLLERAKQEAVGRDLDSKDMDADVRPSMQLKA